jgi:hypothetical protein
MTLGLALGHDLGLAPEAGEVMPDITVVLLDGKRQIL